jgi:putative ABC transport system ATP-binding protein
LDRVGVRRGEAVLLDGVTCEIRAGACTAVMGPSGAGKSTLLRLLVRLADPSSGRIVLDGRPLAEWDVLALRRRVALIAQTPVLLTDRVIDDLRVGRPDLTAERAAMLLDRVGLSAGMADRATAGLSGGEAQRVCLARALVVGPEVVVADEPTAALDPVSAAAVERLVTGLVMEGVTVVLVSHDAAQVRRVADEVLVLEQGRLMGRGAPHGLDYLTRKSPNERAGEGAAGA